MNRRNLRRGEDHAVGVSAWIFGWRFKEIPIGGAGLSAGERRKGAYRLGSGLLGRGLDPELGRIGAPRPFFLFLLFFFLFSCFLFFDLFHIFCIRPPNQVKPIYIFSKIQHNNTE
jgi:hypothetical protein